MAAKMAAAFRQHVPDLSIPRFTAAREQDAYSYAQAFEKYQHPPWLYGLTKAWEKLLAQPYKGLTTDGNVREGLFEPQDEGVNVAGIAAAASKLLDALSETQKAKVSYAINAQEWRAWSNPEFLLRPFGLRLDELPEETAASVLEIVRLSLSPEGYEKAMGAMRINGFLGELCQMPKVMNSLSYNFLLFGKPSATDAWGWSLYGHHLCLNVFLKNSQVVISPTFTGAEPNMIDAGRFEGTKILHREGAVGLQLMQGLDSESRRKACIFKQMKDADMQLTGDLVTDRWNKDDQRHLCGAFRDNRIVPYEGICVAQFQQHQRALVMSIAELFLLYLPTQARRMKLAQIEKHLGETYFCWIGGHGDDDPFYYRIQSPVVVFEFDHHSGVFLTNEEPAKFHIHTIVRTPNAGDYGNALRNPKDRL